jgi:hypothetical protein
LSYRSDHSLINGQDNDHADDIAEKARFLFTEMGGIFHFIAWSESGSTL